MKEVINNKFRKRKMNAVSSLILIPILLMWPPLGLGVERQRVFFYHPNKK